MSGEGAPLAQKRLSPELIGLGLLTAAALALRLRGVAEGLYHDELYTYAETHGQGFAGMFDMVVHGVPGAETERTPPLYFVLAWLGSRLGSPETTIRLPSIVLGTATVPVVFLLGRRTVGSRAALFGAAFFALSPFAIFYGIEARAYATLMFLSALSALILLRAVDERRARWWVAWALTAAAVLYTHYTGALVLAIEVGWVLWQARDRWRQLALACAGAAVLFAPWLPYVKSTGADYERLAAVVGIHDWSAFLQWILGNPEELPARFPGTLVLVLLGAAAGVGLLGALLARSDPWRSPPLRLVLLLAVCPPLALLLYALVGDDLFVYPRNMSVALPFAGLALGWLLTRPAWPLAGVGLALATTALAIGAAMTLQDRFHRPNSPAVARALDERLGPGDAVIYYGAALDPLVVGALLNVYLRERHRVEGASDSGPSLRHALAVARNGPRAVPLVRFDRGGPQPQMPGWDHREERELEGTTPLVLASYAPLSEERYRRLRLVAGSATGAIDSAALAEGILTVSGWAVTGEARPPGHLLAFAGGRLLAAGVPNRSRPDAEQVQHASTDEIGFVLELPGSLTAAQRAQIRVIATDGRTGAQLPRYCSPQVRDLLGC